MRVKPTPSSGLSLHLAGELADGVVIGLGMSVDIVAEKIATVREAAAAAGRNPDAIDIWGLAFASLATTLTRPSGTSPHSWLLSGQWASRRRPHRAGPPARVLSQRPDAGMSDIAEEAGVGRATLYRHFPTRESLIRGVQDAGSAELVAAFASAGLDELPVDRAIARITGIFLRTGTKYAAVISHEDEHREHAARDRAIEPIRVVIDRGLRDGELRADLPGGALFEMYSALIARTASHHHREAHSRAGRGCRGRGVSRRRLTRAPLSYQWVACHI
jgi:TetR/AcrR family transcriptional regulator, mexCD-oprJ operon repressor